MEAVSKWIIGWIYVMIPGFIYIIGIFLLWQYNTKGKFFKVRKINPSFFPYILILLIIFSYVIGLSAHYTFEKIYNWICHVTVVKKASNNLQFRFDWSYYYQYLIMWRHLFISILCLFIILVFSKYRKNLKWPIWFIFIIALIIILITYLEQKQILKSLDPNDSKYQIEQELSKKE
jgi:hypothetical protein